MSFFHNVEQRWPDMMDTRMRIRRQLRKEDVGRDKQGEGDRKTQPTEVRRKIQEIRKIVFKQISGAKKGAYQQYLGHGFEILGVMDFVATPKFPQDLLVPLCLLNENQSPIPNGLYVNSS